MSILTLKSFPLFRFIAYTVLVAFVGLLPAQPSYAQVSIVMPAPGQMIHITRHFEPPQMLGLQVNLKDPFSFNFIMDQGESEMSNADKKEEFNKIIKYFLVSLAMPNRDMWVNLSPYESTRIIPSVFGQTEMGRDLLAQDYILKQFTASLMYPEDGLGKTFWNKVYSEAQARFGTTDINVNTFNKVWIVADKADVYQKGDTAFLVKSHLKVMLEQDFMAIEKNQEQFGNAQALAAADDNPKTKMASDIVRQIIIPAIEKEVNDGKSFAAVRQVYGAEIMATWFKKTLRQSLLGQVFANKSKIAGQQNSDPNADEKIYQQYLKAYKKGVFNYIKEDATPDGQVIPRKYFSGGYQVLDPNKVQAMSAETIANNPAEKLEVQQAMSVMQRARAWVATAALGLSLFGAAKPVEAKVSPTNAIHNVESKAKRAAGQVVAFPGNVFAAPARVKETRDRVKGIQSSIDALRDQIRGLSVDLSTKLGLLSPIMDKYMKKLGDLQDTVNGFQKETRAATADEKARLDAIDGQIADIKASITDLTTKIDNNTVKLTDVQDKLYELDRKLDGLEALRRQVAGLQTTTNRISHDVTTIATNQATDHTVLVQTAADAHQALADIHDLKVANDTNKTILDAIKNKMDETPWWAWVIMGITGATLLLVIGGITYQFKNKKEAQAKIDELQKKVTDNDAATQKKLDKVQEALDKLTAAGQPQPALTQALAAAADTADKNNKVDITNPEIQPPANSAADDLAAQQRAAQLDAIQQQQDGINALVERFKNDIAEKENNFHPDGVPFTVDELRNVRNYFLGRVLLAIQRFQVSGGSVSDAIRILEEMAPEEKEVSAYYVHQNNGENIDHLQVLDNTVQPLLANLEAQRKTVSVTKDVAPAPAPAARPATNQLTDLNTAFEQARAELAQADANVATVQQLPITQAVGPMVGVLKAQQEARVKYGKAMQALETAIMDILNGAPAGTAGVEEAAAKLTAAQDKVELAIKAEGAARTALAEARANLDAVDPTKKKEFRRVTEAHVKASDDFRIASAAKEKAFKDLDQARTDALAVAQPMAQTTAATADPVADLEAEIIQAQKAERTAFFAANQPGIPAAEGAIAAEKYRIANERLQALQERLRLLKKDAEAKAPAAAQAPKQAAVQSAKEKFDAAKTNLDLANDKLNAARGAHAQAGVKLTATPLSSPDRQAVENDFTRTRQDEITATNDWMDASRVYFDADMNFRMSGEQDVNPKAVPPAVEGQPAVEPAAVQPAAPAITVDNVNAEIENTSKERQRILKVESDYTKARNGNNIQGEVADGQLGRAVFALENNKEFANVTDQEARRATRNITVARTSASNFDHLSYMRATRARLVADEESKLTALAAYRDHLKATEGGKVDPRIVGISDLFYGLRMNKGLDFEEQKKAAARLVLGSPNFSSDDAKALLATVSAAFDKAKTDENNGIRNAFQQLDQQLAKMTLDAQKSRLEQDLKDKGIDNVGGINLSDENLTLNIKVADNGMPLPAQFQSKAFMNLNGLTSIIRKISPVTPENVPAMYELVQ